MFISGSVPSICSDKETKAGRTDSALNTNLDKSIKGALRDEN